MKRSLDDNTDIRVFGNDDESLRILGQLLSSETSRKIIQILIKEEMYANQISNKLGIQINTILFHLKKLADLGLVTVTHKQIVKKGVDHKYYKMIPNIFVTVTLPKKEIHEKGFLKRIFRDGVKFTIIGIAGIISFIIPHEFYSRNTWSGLYIENELSLELPLLVITIGLIIETIHFRIKNKKRM